MLSVTCEEESEEGNTVMITTEVVAWTLRVGVTTFFISARNIAQEVGEVIPRSHRTAGEASKRSALTFLSCGMVAALIADSELPHPTF